MARWEEAGNTVDERLLASAGELFKLRETVV